MSLNPWNRFFKEKIIKIFREKKQIIDIGGGLRVSSSRGNRFDPNREWILPLLAKVDYKILDAVSDFHPDIVGDIHNLPFPDNSQEAILCIAVLEHVVNPIKACEEIYRVLKRGGYAFVYVPFLYYYHAEKGYYQDYWRFSQDAVTMLFKNFSVVEVQKVRGAIATWIKLSPWGRFRLFNYLAEVLDRLLKKQESRQVSGFNIFLVK